MEVGNPLFIKESSLLRDHAIHFHVNELYAALAGLGLSKKFGPPSWTWPFGLEGMRLRSKS